MVTVVGLGFVGLTTALGFAEYGHKVYGIEVNKERLETIMSGKLPFVEPGLDQALLKHLNNNFIPTTDWHKAIADSEYVYYCVGTPYGENGEADLTFLYNAIEETLDAINDNKFRVLVTKSTIPPSTSERKIIPFLQKHGIRVPEQLGVANNPEFLREGHCWEDFIDADRIVLGVSDKKSEKMLCALYEKSNVPIHCVSLNTGEFIKYLSNTSLACLISYANEMSVAAEAIGGIDISSAFKILHEDKRWKSGSIRNYFYPGCGYGGYCLPKDTNAFYALVKNTMNIDCKILKNIININDSMPEITAKKIIKLVAGNKNCSIGILGLSFNPGSDDTRDTPSAKIVKALNDEGYSNILGYDPVAIDEFKKYYPQLQIRYVDTYENIVNNSDVLAIVTGWDEFKDLGERTNKPIVDCRYIL